MDARSNLYQSSLKAESEDVFNISPVLETSFTCESMDHERAAGKTRAPTKATRRIKGEIACAECRRLKIRCDKTIPCSTCVKRGCAALCPNGTIPPGEGSRFVLAATDHLQQKLTRMEARMRSLEDALAIVQATESDEPHPLLIDYEDGEEEGNVLKPVTEHTSSLESALGTLHLDGRGGARFFGPSGGSESLLLQEEGHFDLRPLQDLDPSYLPSEINDCYQSFPFTPPGILVQPVQAQIEACLPPADHAIALCDTFLEHLSWMFHIVSRQLIVKELIPAIYRQTNVSYGPHDLALLLIVLAVGSLVDLKLPPYNLEAQHYHRLARATLALQPVLAEQSVVTIKVLHLMSLYNGMSGKESNLEQSYILLNLASQVALRIGFHIDPSMWGIKGREAYDRRVYFWNLMAGVLWQSLVTGRPPGLVTSFIGCQIPTAEEEHLYQQGEVPLGFGIWGFRASLECLIPVTKAILAAKPPGYKTIMELDRLIRDLALPKNDDPQNQANRTAISMRIFVRSHYQDLMLMFLHRGYFAQAMSENPENPLDSQYSSSVLAAYGSACTILRDTKKQYDLKPLLCARVWRIWSFTFSAAMIVGTVAIQGLHMNLQPHPLPEFQVACEIFKGAAETSNRAARALPILQTMLQKAIEAREYHQRGQHAPPGPSNTDDELSLFAGRTRVINQKTLLLHSPRSTSNNPRSAILVSNPTSLQSSAHRPRHPQFQRSTEAGPSSSSSNFQGPGPQLRDRQMGCIATHNPTNKPTTIADLSGDWGGLLCEVPDPLHAMPAPTNAAAQSVAPQGMNDKWSSFMHNYEILGDPNTKLR